ncbi:MULTISPECIES: roadblock/LC7 domain-containing protein [Streptomyces]|uniref:Roadblock/LC7 domain-containing protein n=1 Tax=Streptomyces luteolus TaxID=3043615 RepID=A0ABT6T5Y4_9ACTN|nr:MULTISPECIES: roadblock/LC7 domain-containing protein [unclassified Streptomyces]MDI3423270.1 roadblock/LC7 domain-containing protein [Streptomyces sp. B-S-A12]MDQ8701387.1 roadblock/LC7 domain-containing protein [Streptomyces sp. LHD-70]
MTPTYTVTNLGDGDRSGGEGRGGVDWLLDDLVDRVAEVRHAVMLSSDGLCVGASTGMGRDESERFSAIASGFHSLAKGAGRHFDAGGVVQTMVELQGGFLFVVAAGDGSCLAVFTDGHADIGLVAYEMALLVDRVREHLGVPTRADGETP